MTTMTTRVKGRGRTVTIGDDEDSRQIAKWEHEIKSLRKNLAFS